MDMFIHGANYTLQLKNTELEISAMYLSRYSTFFETFENIFIDNSTNNVIEIKDVLSANPNQHKK